MHFRKTFEDRVFDFKKENGRVNIAYLENSKLDTNTYKEKVYEEKKETFQKLDFENYEKVETKGTKKIGVLINSFDELIDAIKCVLWSLDNEPSTIIKIFQHILVMKNNQRTAQNTNTASIQLHTPNTLSLSRSLSLSLTHTHTQHTYF